MQPLKSQEREGSPPVECYNCARNREIQTKMTAELESVQNELEKIIRWKDNWKNGKVTLDDVHKEFLNRHHK